jgi:hypothetical protein
MKIFSKELNKSFNTKDELFKALFENESLILNAKKSEIYKSFEKGHNIVTDQTAIKKAFDNSEKGIDFDENYYYIVVNSANFLDTHKDVHVDGNWEKTTKEQQGKVYLVFDHTLKRSEIIATAQDIEIFTAKVPWAFLGKNYEGETYSLVYKVLKEKIINNDAKEWLEKGYKLQASVRMQYVKIESAFNSDNPDYAKQKSVYDEYIQRIANKDEFEEIDYFWVVKEAKNVMESSLLLFGSNSATGVLDTKTTQAEQSLVTTEPTPVTQIKRKKVLLT